MQESRQQAYASGAQVGYVFGLARDALAGLMRQAMVGLALYHLAQTLPQRRLLLRLWQALGWVTSAYEDERQRAEELALVHDGAGNLAREKGGWRLWVAAWLMSAAWHAPLATGLSALVLMLALAYALARGIVAMM